MSYRDLRHGDRDVLGLHTELHTLLQVGGEALGFVRPLAPVLAGAAAGHSKHHSEQSNPPGPGRVLGWHHGKQALWHGNDASRQGPRMIEACTGARLSPEASGVFYIQLFLLAQE